MTTGCEIVLTSGKQRKIKSYYLFIKCLTVPKARKRYACGLLFFKIDCAYYHFRQVGNGVGAVVIQPSHRGVE